MIYTCNKKYGRQKIAWYSVIHTPVKLLGDIEEKAAHCNDAKHDCLWQQSTNGDLSDQTIFFLWSTVQ